MTYSAWWCRNEALRALHAQFFEVSKALEQIVDEDPKAGPQANGLLSTMHTYEFIFALVLMLEVFQISNVLSKQLQSSTLFMSESCTITNGVILEFRNMQKDNSFFGNFWNESLALAKACNISTEPKLLRTCKTPAKLGGENATPVYADAKEYYLVNVYYAILDIMITQIEKHFDESDLHLLHAIETTVLKHDSYSITKVCNTYSLDSKDLEAELQIFFNILKENHEVHKLDTTMVIEEYRPQPKQVLPTLYQLLSIYTCIACNTAGTERFFSYLKKLKTDLRNTMGPERLNSLAILTIERGFQPDINSVIDQFAAKKRHLAL